ncbi:MAG: OadG family protein [Lachnospiraceae bacterium]|nr:OadG family protein [Lachnospiraceae bacterium]
MGLVLASIRDELSSAGINTIVGMATVFIVLILISFIISLFSKIALIQEFFEERARKKQLKKLREQNDNNEVTVTENTESSDTDDIVYEEVDISDDSELVAVIMGALYEYMGDSVPADGLVVRSIRKVRRVR